MSTEILIIDDNADIRNILDDLIKDAGYKTRLAANYNQALIEIDKKLQRPSEVDTLLGNCNKAKKKLRWRPKYNFKDLVEDMVEEDLKFVEKEGY